MTSPFVTKTTPEPDTPSRTRVTTASSPQKKQISCFLTFGTRLSWPAPENRAKKILSPFGMNWTTTAALTPHSPSPSVCSSNASPPSPCRDSAVLSSNPWKQATPKRRKSPVPKHQRLPRATRKKKRKFITRHPPTSPAICMPSGADTTEISRKVRER